MTMRMMQVISAAVWMSSGSMAIWGQQGDKTPLGRGGLEGSAQSVGEKLQEIGSQPVDEKSAMQIRTALAQLVNDAITQGKFSAAVGALARGDRDRIGDMSRENYDELNKVVGELRRAYADKYGYEPFLKAEQLVASEVIRGPRDNTATFTLKAFGTKPEAKTPEKAMEEDKGKIKLPAASAPVNGPTVSLVNEGANGTPSWKVDIPNEIGGKQLKVTLARKLQKVVDEKAIWADDPNATAHAIASEVLAALTDSTIVVDR